MFNIWPGGQIHTLGTKLGVGLGLLLVPINEGMYKVRVGYIPDIDKAMVFTPVFIWSK